MVFLFVMMNATYFFSKGKLLLTSEYFVLDGALSLAIPTKLGQDLLVEKNKTNKHFINWKAYHQNNLWLEVCVDFSKWEIISTNNAKAADFVIRVLKAVDALSPSFFLNYGDCTVTTNLQFPSNYGLGSSSTLMANVANWAGIDAFLLNELVLGGSGYDVAVALLNSAIVYQNFPFREIEKINYQPSFASELIFIHLNQKQDSREGIKMYRTKEKNERQIAEFSTLTQKILQTTSLQDFSCLMEIHENKLSSFLGIPTIKSQFFQDCPGFVKSLGAWGGDFVLSRKFPDYKVYFSEKGFSDIWSWENLIG